MHSPAVRPGRAGRSRVAPGVVLVALATVVAAITAGCGSPSAPAASIPGATPTAPTPRPATAAEVLTLVDLPAGWVVDHSPISGAGHGCDQVAPILASGGARVVEASFNEANSRSLPAMNEALTAPSTAMSLYARIAANLSGCRRFSSASGASTITFTQAPTSFPALGRRSRAVIRTAVIAGSTLVEYEVAVFDGREVLVINYGNVGSANLDQAETLARAAVAKLNRPGAG